MPSWSLVAPDARVRQSFMMMAGAVMVASAITQAVTHPVFTAGPDLAAPVETAQVISAPAPMVAAVQAAAAVPAFAFRAPTPGYPVNSPFGLRRLPWEPRGRMHEGVDIAAPRGMKVGATLPGTVIRAGSSPTYGRFVELRHADGLTSLYGHLGSIRRGLKAGMPVAAGEAIGLVGDTGRSTGEHLHFEIRSEGKPLNPALFIDKTFADAEALPLTAAARFSRRVRQAVVSPAALARMMPKVAKAEAATVVKPAKDGRVGAVLAMGDPSPTAMKAAAEARATAAPPAAEAPAPASEPATDFSAARLDQTG